VGGMNIILKAIIYLIFYSLLHFGYELTNWSFLIPFSGTNESVFQHLKLAFWAYFLTNIIEYFLIKGKRNEENFWYKRLLSTVLIPWLIVIIWYILPGIIGPLESLWLELSWSFFVTFFSALLVIEIERSITRISNEFKVVVSLLFLISIFFFIRFSFGTPYLDIFQIP
jgi:hypothetical protein